MYTDCVTHTDEQRPRRPAKTSAAANRRCCSNNYGVIVAATLLVISGVSCGGSPDNSQSGSGSCPLELEYRGEVYVGHGLRNHVTVAGREGEAVTSSCDDGNGGDNGYTVAVSSVRGVKPTIALVTTESPHDVLYVLASLDAAPPRVRRLLR